MIKQVGYKNSLIIELLDIIKDCEQDEDFYFTQNNERYKVKSKINLLNLLKQSHHIYYIDSENKKGIIFVWKSFGGEKSRKYIKIIANDLVTAKNLLQMLLWHYSKDLYVKLKKESYYLSVFKEKGFKFVAGRGNEILFVKQNFFQNTLLPKKEVEI